MTGLNLTEDEFMQMKTDQKLLILYRNTQEVKGLVMTFNFHKKLHYWWLSGVSTLVVALFGVRLL